MVGANALPNGQNGSGRLPGLVDGKEEKDRLLWTALPQAAEVVSMRVW